MVVEGLDKVYLYEEMFCIGVQTFVSKPSEGCSLGPEPGPVPVNAKRVEDPVILMYSMALDKGKHYQEPLTRVCILPPKWSFVVFFYTKWKSFHSNSIFKHNPSTTTHQFGAPMQVNSHTKSQPKNLQVPSSRSTPNHHH